MISMFLMMVSVLFAVANNLLLHAVENKGIRGTKDAVFFNALVSLIWIAILSVLNLGKPISHQALLWGIGYGSVMSAFLLCKMQAMATGPVSVTSFIGCSSLIISTAFGVFYFHETVSAIQVSGIVLLIFALFLTVPRQEHDSENKCKKTKIWFFWCTLFFVCSGATGIVFKLHQASSARNEVNQMMLAASITSVILFLATSFVLKRKTDKPLPRMSLSTWMVVIACGIVSCGYNRLNISLSGMLPSIVFFPTFNGSVIFLASLFAAVLFHEKITKRQATGIAIGIVALMMASGVFNV